MFGTSKTGTLVPISGTDPERGPWQHWAFPPDPLPEESPELSGATYRVVANARASLGLSYGRVNKLVTSLVDLGILKSLGDQAYNRRFYAPDVLNILLGNESHS